MERIERPYAIIYIDREGETLKEDVENFTPTALIHDYYKMSGFLQWNFYLIISSEIAGDRKEEIESDETYTRKYVMPSSEINQFVTERFPEFKEEDGQPRLGKIMLLKGNNWKHAESLLDNALIEMSVKYPNKKYPVQFIGSWYRDENLMYAITELDLLRAALINDSERTVIFYTHLSDEYFIAQMKFKLFMEEAVAQHTTT